MLNLDTHLLVSLLSGDLTQQEHTLVVNQKLAISAIVLWELAKLVELGRLILDLESSPVGPRWVFPSEARVWRDSCASGALAVHRP